MDNDIIDMAYIQEKIEMRKREELINKHPYKIWQGGNGYWYTYVPDEIKKRKIIKKCTKASVEDAIVEFWKEKSNNPTIKEVFDEWNNRRLDLEKISKATHLRNIQVFNRHYSEFGKRGIKSVSADSIENFLEEQIPKFSLTAKAFSNLKTITRGLFKRAKRRKLCNLNVEEILNELDVSESNFKKIIKEDYMEVFNEVEMETMMNYLYNNQDILNLAIMLMFVSGIRVGELVALKPKDFISNCEINIRRTETRYKDVNNEYVCEIKEYPKTNAGVRTIVIPLSYSWIIKKLLCLNPFGEYIFLKNAKRISAQSVRMRLNVLCKNLNIYHKSPHKIRKTYGSILLDNQIDQRMIMGQMGHTDISCTENHYHRNRKSVEKKLKIIDSIPEFNLGERKLITK